MREEQARTSGWVFLPEPEARQLAVECLLIATRFNASFKPVYLGALAEQIVRFQKLHANDLEFVHRMALQQMALSLDASRLEYLGLVEKWAELLNNEIVPLGRALEFMVKGSSKKSAINQTISLYRRKRVELEKARSGKLQFLPEIQQWPDGYRFLSVDTFQQRFKRFETVLPYVHIYYRNLDAVIWSGLTDTDKLPIVPSDDFEAWNKKVWGLFEDTRRIRMRPPNQPLNLKFQ